ncbi:hypothetical protein [Nocardia sp. AG03]|uniref:hypothetical protein n=1 Tax=Nocardia sp. AG03 TaxID=3025312 RepID=UPI002418B4CB|nr:hypothetical protein [Nocardia sp. AG03]
MKRWIATALTELALAAIFLVGAALSWSNARRTTEFVGTDEHPGFEAIRYVPPLIVLATGLVIVAGLLVIDAAARGASARSVAPRPIEPMH